jgi:hypothetical protein
MDDGTYTFNPVGQNFANYCELAKYYCGKKSLACVRQTSINDENLSTTFPSCVDLLGIALVLANKFSTLSTQVAKDTDISNITLQAMLQLKKNQSDQSLFVSTPTGCVASFNKSDVLFHDISGISEFDLIKILTFIKRMIFYCKYGVVPNQYLEVLTFDKIFNDKDRCKQHLIDQTKFNDNVVKLNFELYKKNFFTPFNLSSSQASSAQASSAQASSATPAPPSAAPAPRSADLESRVATLERDVAALIARQ